MSSRLAGIPRNYTEAARWNVVEQAGKSSVRPKQRSVHDGAARLPVRPLLAIEAEPRRLGPMLAEGLIHAQPAVLRIEPGQQHPALLVTGDDQPVAGTVRCQPMRHGELRT